MAIDITMPRIGAKIPAPLLYKSYEKVNELGGIYFLYDKDGTLLYVGQTKNLFTRLKSHLVGRDNSRWFCDMIHMIHIYYVLDSYEREIYETYAINEYKPVYNTSKVFNKRKSSAELIRDERISELRDERRCLVAENYEIQTYFDDLVVYGEDDLDFEELSDWGVLIQNKRRIGEIDQRINEIKREKLT